jgi:hypothetical protein
MSDHDKNTKRIRVDRAKHIPEADKEKYLANFTEDQFRDLVIIRIFKLRGFIYDRETHGANEQGKDLIFTVQDPLGVEQVYAIQAKRGSLTMASKATENIETALTQLRTALAAEVVVGKPRRKVKPDTVLLCASGKINEPARTHIANEIKDNRIRFMDMFDLIPLIDEHCPEFWYGIDADKMPYFEKLRSLLLQSSDTIVLPDRNDEVQERTAITDDKYVPIFLHHITTKSTKEKGVEKTEPELKEVHISALLDEDKESLFLVIGEGGSGKTTALRRLAYMVVDRALRSLKIRTIPIFLKAIDILTKKERLVEIAGQNTAELSKSGKHAFSSKELEEGQVAILIDALDEIGNDNDRAKVLTKILEFNHEYQKCKVIVTSRDYNFVKKMPILSGFSRYFLSPIDYRQASKIAETLIKERSLPADATKEMLRRLQDVHGISLNPLLVTVFVATSDVSRKDIPANITEIFKKFSELMLGRWDEKKGLAQQFHSQVKDFLLQRLAFRMHKERMTFIPVGEARELFEQELTARGHEAKVEQFFEEVVDRSGLLRIEGDNVEFRHHLLQEFFAGRAIASLDWLKTSAGDEWWRKAIVFYFGEHPDRIEELLELAKGIKAVTPSDRVNASITIGLSLQACYLSEVAKKELALEWVVGELSSESALPPAESQVPNFRPMNAFLGYYLSARDAVACDLMKNVAERLVGVNSERNVSKSSELQEFWCIVGLLEAGHLEKAEILIKKFKPDDLRLLLAIDFGCFFIANLRITSDGDKKIAWRIHDRISPKVSPLVETFKTEFKSILFEMRKGQIHALATPNDPPNLS